MNRLTLETLLPWPLLALMACNAFMPLARLGARPIISTLTQIVCYYTQCKIEQEAKAVINFLECAKVCIRDEERISLD